MEQHYTPKNLALVMFFGAVLSVVWVLMVFASSSNPRVAGAAESSCQADYNIDGVVDAADLSIFAENYAKADLNCALDLVEGNCFLNEQDFEEFEKEYKQEQCTLSNVSSSSSSSSQNTSSAQSTSSATSSSESELVMCGNPTTCPDCVSGPTPVETVTATKEMEFAADEVMKGDYATPVVTGPDGSIYMTYIQKVGGRLHTMIAKKSPNGRITTTTIYEYTENDIYHVIASIGIDKQGYIHLAGNMHSSPYRFRDGNVPLWQYPWQYWVSKDPYDISEFEFVGDEGPRGSDEQFCWIDYPIAEIPSRVPTACFTTYPFFSTDRNGELYLSYRERVKYDQGDGPGNMAADVSKYDVETKTWQQLGGNNLNGYGEQFSTLFWSAKQRDSRAYQPMKPRVIFDKYNRMHVATGMQTFGNSSDGTRTSSITEVLYACSDDGGETWKKANGEVFGQLPMDENNSDIVRIDHSGQTHNYTGLAVHPSGELFSTLPYRDDGWKMNWSTFKDSVWSDAGAYTGSYPGHIIIDDYGVLTTFSTNSINRSYDSGQTWQSYQIPDGDRGTTLLDIRYTQETGEVRYLTYNSGMAVVYTLSFN